MQACMHLPAYSHALALVCTAESEHSIRIATRVSIHRHEGGPEQATKCCSIKRNGEPLSPFCLLSRPILNFLFTFISLILSLSPSTTAAATTSTTTLARVHSIAQHFCAYTHFWPEYYDASLGSTTACVFTCEKLRHHIWILCAKASVRLPTTTPCFASSHPE